MKTTDAISGTGRGRRLLDRIGLDRPELRAWALYDWAKSAFETTIGAAVFPAYWGTVAAATLAPNVATSYLGFTHSIALLIIALAAPVLGAVADFMGAKKRFLAVFMGVGVIATGGLFLVQRGDWLLAAILFIIGTIGVTGSTIFSDSLLPHIAADEEIDRVSTAGYALGYFGGGVLLAINVVMIASPGAIGLPDASMAVRVVFLTVAAWWLLFALPLLRGVPEPTRRIEHVERVDQRPVRAGFARLRETFGEIRQYRELFKFLLAYWLYIDGIHTIQKMAVVYGTELALPRSTLIGAILLVQFVGIPATFAFGAIAGRIGARNGLYIALAVYTAIATFGYFVREAWHFWMLAIFVGLVQGGAQALSRSLYAGMVPRAKSSEFFSFFSIFEKFGGIVGPALFGAVALLTGTSRLGILALVAFFVGGIALLTTVDIAAGRAAARREDASLHVVGIEPGSRP
ncbi:MAG: MFS transporter [Longimicrobiales bacterium]